MLTIERKEREAVIIQTPDGEEIRIVLHDLRNDRVKVSIDASKEYIITREELLEDSSNA